MGATPEAARERTGGVVVFGRMDRMTGHHTAGVGVRARPEGARPEGRHRGRPDCGFCAVPGVTRGARSAPVATDRRRARQITMAKEPYSCLTGRSRNSGVVCENV